MTISQQEHLTLETPILNYAAPNIQALISKKRWEHLPIYDRIGAIYTFVRDDILFGYNAKDALPASQVLQDGYGQCNTKATLLMALFRAVNIPCRLHGFTITKTLQRGVVPELIYPIAPPNILHSWVEVFYDGKWINLEGFILDRPYLSALQTKYNTVKTLCRYGVGTENLQAPAIDWCGQDTYIQKTGINADFGIFDTPDDFYATHRQAFSPLKLTLYTYFIRHWMNARVAKLRKGNL